jgi:uncharacterized protein (DUF1778 family)
MAHEDRQRIEAAARGSARTLSEFCREALVANADVALNDSAARRDRRGD